MHLALLMFALHAAPKTVNPKATLTVSNRELHTFALCTDQLVVSAGSQLQSGRLDLAKKTYTAQHTEQADVWAMAFTPSCGVLVTEQSTGENAERIHDATVRSMKGGAMHAVSSIGTFALPVSSIDVSSDGAFVAMATNGGEVMTFALDAQGKTKKVFEAPKLPKGDQVLHLRLTKSHLVAGTYRGSVLAWPFDASTGALGPARTLMTPTAPTRESGSLDTTTGAIVMPGGARVLDLTTSNEGSRVWAAVESGSILSWELSGATPVGATVVTGLDGAGHVAVSPDGTLLAASGNFSARLYSVSGTTATLKGELGGLMFIDKYVLVRRLHFAGKRLVVGTGDLSVGKLVIYEP